MHTTYSEYNDSSISYNHSCFNTLRWTGIEPQTHDGYELIFLKNGDITYLIDGKSYRVKKNSLIIIRPGKRHIILFNSPVVYDRYDIIFDENIIPRGVAAGIPDSIDVAVLGEYPKVAELFGKMDYYYQHFGGEDFKNILSQLINEIFYNMIIISRRPGSVTDSSFTENPVVTAAVDYIENNIGSDLSLDVLCNELFISKSYLHQLFSEHLKISPQKFITAKRLMLIQKEIRSGTRPTEAYLNYGFSDYSTFYRAYKKHFGYPPSEEAEREIVREIKL